MSPVRLHSSNPNLCADIEFQTPPSHVSDPLETSMDYIKLQEEFCLMAQKGNCMCTNCIPLEMTFEALSFAQSSVCMSSLCCLVLLAEGKKEEVEWDNY